MEAVKRYLEMNKRYQDFIGGKIDFPQADSSHLNDFARILVDVADENGYTLYSCYNNDPRVAIFAISHTDRRIDQGTQLEKILLEVISPEDLVMCEGRGPIEISYPHYHREDLFGRLKEHFSRNNVRIIFNDDNMKIGEFMVASNHIKKLKEKLGEDYSHPEMQEAIERYVRAFDARDLNFCEHPSGGIIPLIDGTTTNYKKLPPHAKIFQLVGLLHVYNGVMQRRLEEKDVSHIMFVPRSNESN